MPILTPGPAVSWCGCQKAPATTGSISRCFFNPERQELAGGKLSSTLQTEQIRNAECDLLDLDVYFEPQSQRYLVPSAHGWTPLSKENLEIQLIRRGYRKSVKKGKVLRPIVNICA